MNRIDGPPSQPEQANALRQWLEAADLYQYLIRSATLSDDGNTIEVVYSDDEGQDQTISKPSHIGELDGSTAFG